MTRATLTPRRRQGYAGSVDSPLANPHMPRLFGRAPDYFVLDLGGGYWGGGSALVTVSRSGHIFAGAGPSVTVPGGSAAVRAGSIIQSQRTTSTQVDQFVSGWSPSLSVFPAFFGGVSGPSIAGTWGNPFCVSGECGGVEVGIGFGAGHTASIGGTYSWQLPSSWNVQPW